MAVAGLRRRRRSSEGSQVVRNAWCSEMQRGQRFSTWSSSQSRQRRATRSCIMTPWRPHSWGRLLGLSVYQRMPTSAGADSRQCQREKFGEPGDDPAAGACGAGSPASYHHHVNWKVPAVVYRISPDRTGAVKPVTIPITSVTPQARSPSDVRYVELVKSALRESSAMNPPRAAIVSLRSKVRPAYLRPESRGKATRSLSVVCLLDLVSAARQIVGLMQGLRVAVRSSLPHTWPRLDGRQTSAARVVCRHHCAPRLSSLYRS